MNTLIGTVNHISLRPSGDVTVRVEFSDDESAESGLSFFVPREDREFHVGDKVTVNVDSIELVRTSEPL